MMIRIVTNRFGTYLKKGNKTIFITINSVRRLEVSFRYIMDNIGSIMSNIESNESGVILFPSTKMFDEFAALYRIVNIHSCSEDFARLVVHSASMLSRKSVLA